MRSDMSSSRQRHDRSEEDRLRTERDYFRDKFEILEPQMLQGQEEIRRLRANLEVERGRAERAVRSADLMQSSMDNREYFLGEQTSDDDVCTMFGTLMTDIMLWSQNFSHGDAKPLREDRFQDYQMITPMYTALGDLEDATAKKKQRRFFVRGWAGYVMCMRLFCGPAGAAGVRAEDAWLEKDVAGKFKFLESQLLRAAAGESPSWTYAHRSPC